MGLRPIAIYAYSLSTNYILRQESLTGQITIDHEGLLLVFRASDFPPYRVITRPRITFTTHRHPTANDWHVAFNNRILLTPPKVGEKLSLDNSSLNHGYCNYVGASSWHPEQAGTYDFNDYPVVPTFNDYVYIQVYASAVEFDGNVGTLTADQRFTFSNFDLTYTTGTLYPFSITSSFMGGYKNHLRDNSFELSAVYHSDVIVQYSIANSTIHYKKTGESSYQSLTSIGNTVTVPAGTFDSGSTYDVYFTAQSTSGASASTDPVTLSTVDGPAVVSPVSPNNEVTYGDITYSWNYSNTTGETQYAFDIQISPDGATWTTVLDHVVSSQTRAEYTQTSAGDTYWRVRGYNQNDVAGAWSSEAHYINNVPPQPPVILEIVPGGRIQVRWSAENQISYKIEVINVTTNQTVYASGEVYGTESLALVNTYLPNGNYTIRVKISNIYGKESSWASTSYTQRAELPAFQYYASYANGGVLINVASDEFESFYLLRNGELIAHFEETTYTDLFASGETNYKLIAVNSEDDFAQVTFTINAAIPSARLITQDGQVLTVSERWDNFNNVEQSEDSRYSANEYLGASAPEHLFSKMRVKRFTRAFYDPNRIARQLLGTVAFYADEYGNGEWVAITSYTRADSWLGDDTKIEMEVTTRKERVTYVV